jgi:type I restriction enzyme R subunit
LSSADELRLAAEQRARMLIDRQLADAGWDAQHKKNLNLSTGQGVGVRTTCSTSTGAPSATLS